MQILCFCHFKIHLIINNLFLASLTPQNHFWKVAEPFQVCNCFWDQVKRHEAPELSFKGLKKMDPSIQCTFEINANSGGKYCAHYRGLKITDRT